MADARAVMAAHQDAAPAGEPFVTAREFLASCLDRLGCYAAAFDEFTALLESSVSMLGGDDARVIRWRVGRAAELFYLGRFVEADGEYRRAAADAREARPRSKRATLRLASECGVVTALNGQGAHAEAESAARSAMKEGDMSDGAPLRLLSFLHLGLGRSLIGQERYVEAEQVLADLKFAAAPDVVAKQTALAEARLGAGKLDEAEAGVRHAVAVGEHSLSSRHHLTLAAGTLLGSVLARRGRMDEAESWLVANVAAWEDYFGAIHPRTVIAREVLAEVRCASN